VLNNLSEQIRECLEHAEDCGLKAAELPNGSRFRQDFLQLEKRWLELARSIEFGESLDTFTKNRNGATPPFGNRAARSLVTSFEVTDEQQRLWAWGKDRH